MKNNDETRVGIGFVTGRKSFQTVLKTNIFNWRECGLTDVERVRLNLFVAYDLKYSSTKATDYTNISDELLDLIDGTCFIGGALIKSEIEHLLNMKVLSSKEAKLFFGGGYAGKRNAVLYMALKNKIDYLIFFDDDEYPMAVTKARTTALWSGQHVLATHLRHINNADITNGHHCGYISPIPYIEFNDIMTEHDFRLFIEAISNDIISWDTIKAVMNSGGVTYADTGILTTEIATEVAQINGAKFISGANLCINLTKPTRVHPFYNPPGARGEDTFLSTCLSENQVLRVPCFTFHDGFSSYRALLNGVLPISLKPIKADNKRIITRFYQACIGWIRYKPLLLYITQPNYYEERITQMQEQLTATLPKICRYFGTEDFMKVSVELEHYHRNVKKHYNEFLSTQQIWFKIRQHLAN